MIDDLRGICRICNTSFYKIVGTQIYCSQTCREEARELNKKSPTKKNCGECGNEFLWLPSKPGQKYCSDTCSRISNMRSIRQSAERKKINETGALKEEIERRVASIFKQAEDTKPTRFAGKVINFWDAVGFTEKIKEEVRERDSYKCMICELSEGQLEVHHVLKRAFGGSNDPHNLITLCTSCHRAVETGDEHHAKRKCFNSALKVLNHSAYVRKDVVTDKQIINQMSCLLEKLFNSLSEENTEGKFTESLIEISNVID